MNNWTILDRILFRLRVLAGRVVQLAGFAAVAIAGYAILQPELEFHGTWEEWGQLPEPILVPSQSLESVLLLCAGIVLVWISTRH